MDDRVGAIKLLTASVRDELMDEVGPHQQQRLAAAYRAYAPPPTEWTWEQPAC
jgi:hypothetical protein